MSSARNNGGTTSDEEMDTILQFAEESSTRELFSKETELTQTWLLAASQDGSSRGRDGNQSCERSNAAHVSVNINDPTTKRRNQKNDPIEDQGRDEPKRVNDVEVSQEGSDSNGLQRVESNTSVVTLMCSTSSTPTDELKCLTAVENKNPDVRSKCLTSFPSTDEQKYLTTVTGKTAGTSTSCEGADGNNISGPVVAKVRRRREGGSSSCRTCSYFCKKTGMMKIIEIIALLFALIIVVGVDDAACYTDSLIIVHGVMLMGLTVTPTMLVCYLLKQTQIQKTLFDSIINGFLALYSIVAGCSTLALLMKSDSNVAVSVALGVFLLIAGLAYAVDCVLAILKYRT